MALQVSLSQVWLGRTGNVTVQRLFNDGPGRIDGKCRHLSHASDIRSMTEDIQIWQLGWPSGSEPSSSTILSM